MGMIMPDNALIGPTQTSVEIKLDLWVDLEAPPWLISPICNFLNGGN